MPSRTLSINIFNSTDTSDLLTRRLAEAKNFRERLPRLIHPTAGKGSSRKLRYGFTSGRYGVVCGAVLAPTTSNITPRPTRTRPGRVAARVRLNRPDLRRSCITVRSTPARLSTAPMRLASSLGCISISPPAPGGRGIIVKYNPLRYKLSSSSLHLELGGCGALGHRAAEKNPSRKPGFRYTQFSETH